MKTAEICVRKSQLKNEKETTLLREWSLCCPAGGAEEKAEDLV